MIKIASWNINSIRARLPILKDWLIQHNPEVVLLQEIKCQIEAFPASDLEDLGYNLAIFGQKSYNGVAILSKFPIDEVITGLPTFYNDESARYIEIITNRIRFASVYVPNGQAVDSSQFQYKLEFFRALYNHLKNISEFEENCIIGGDFNVAPYDIDVYDPLLWKEQTLCTERERLSFRSLINLGFTDVFRLFYPKEIAYTWWDYRQNMYKKNYGLRIDHLLLNPYAVDRALQTGIDTYTRGLPQPSDHAPIWCNLQI